MKRLLMIGFFLFHVVVLAACGRDTEIVGCTSQDDCRGTRICLDRVCTDVDIDASHPKDVNDDTDIEEDISQGDIELDDNENDADSDTSNEDVDAFVCPDLCTGGCDDNKCHIDGFSRNSIECPDGLECVVHCESDNSCSRGIMCGDEKCTILCEGKSSCRGPIDCGDASQCMVRCMGYNACDRSINCGSSECNIECGQMGSKDYTCNGGIDCGTNSCQVACLDERSCTAASGACEGEDCGGAFTCNEAEYCRCMGPGCWPTPD